MAKARRRRVPAFGEWNYNYHHHEQQALPPAVVAPAACYATQEPEPEACSDVWFRYSPAPRKPTPKKQARRRHEGDVSREHSKASWDASRRVVRPVDGDLYQVPPPELASHRRPTKKWSLWMGCLGLSSCVAS
ncbi:hypothetical protein CFC21_066643 [Triticum aestivum]|uniref:RIN4 pathogenic type III effector avirulence factor Avr cleavage site domain-containing protein n=3 Tax=Triticum TaxID=4564 RepID=A0A9R1H7Y6_WHEAT|nr:uncharacterized protein LOC119297611 [Triticum dicoccoides]XP_044385294.1 uncharacterized protein LOC123107375 [Triticum aestivum]XP_048575072.1 uncharacterized protein LOC125556363 [Triticum urartu]XP_048575073.1 uncharacterized protein LOC125556364 [Triticum urartu]VAI19534.1 unnamed protein product [Triticum turgidum subsp. durum]KAF7059776.1 hypothetical protein CFC21_066640 [Triticum aestivum]KAF7059780.1 hypothetical protein CFC21_066643 [Triticum aestivum]